MAERFDLIVIGAGPGGYVAAIRAAQNGKRVACIEKRATLGGTCLNVGCIPSKALLESSELYDLTSHRAARHGIDIQGLSLNLAAMHKRKDGIVKSLTDGVAFLFKKNKVTSFFGTAQVTGQGKVRVQTDKGPVELEGDNILLATGSDPISLPGLTLDGQQIVTSTEALNFPEVPKKLVVVGGGYIGLELGSVWARLGSEVTVVEFLPRILPLNDAEIVAMVQKSLTKQGLRFVLSTKVTGTVREGGKLFVTVEGPDGKGKMEADKVLVSIGRRPCSANLGLEAVGVKMDARSGRVEVDEQFRTNVPGIRAIGDLIAGPMLAHKASEEGIAVADMICGEYGHVNYDTIPGVIYIWPEVASVGRHEEQLKEAGIEYNVGRFPFSANGRAKCLDESEGTIKVLADKKTDRVLGVHIFGPRASDIIAEAVSLMEFKASAEDIARIVHAHPTLSEGFGEAARMAWSGKTIHS